MPNQLSGLDLNKTYSYADYMQWQFSETVELIKGKIALMSPAPKRIHQEASGYLFVRMAYFFQNNACKFYAAPFDVRLPKNAQDPENKIFTVVQHDICVVCDLSKLDENGCKGAPDLIVEITSRSTQQRDFHEKFSLYEEAGVNEYWIADPLEKAIYQNHLVNGKYDHVAIVSEGDTLESRHFQGLKITVAEVFKG